MLLNIDPKYRSSLHSIQLITPCLTKLIEKYPINEILEPFMSSIRCLERVSCIAICHSSLYEYAHTFVLRRGVLDLCRTKSIRCISTL